jgi:arylsulfatase B/arylsulfatase I/J
VYKVLKMMMLLAVFAVSDSRPNLIHIVVDDLGFFDVGYKDTEGISPHLDALRAGGVELGRFYSAKWCAPARAAMLTGRYPWRSGYYSYPSSDAVPLNSSLLPEVLRRAGYRTHAVGKWHLGFEIREYTPTFRGFDTFMGYYNSQEDYWTHVGPQQSGPCSGVDLSNSTGYNSTVGIRAAPSSLNGTYSSEIYGTRVTEIIVDHAAHYNHVPFYLYLPFQSVHMPNEAPAEMIAKYPVMKNSARRSYLGMISALDEALGDLMDAVKSTSMWSNTVLLLNGDNGGPVWCSSNHDCPDAINSQYGPVSNYPLRAGKWTNWDGGFRVNAFISSPLLPAGRVNTTWNGMVHVTDIMATFAALANVSGSSAGTYLQPQPHLHQFSSSAAPPPPPLEFPPSSL